MKRDADIIRDGIAIQTLVIAMIGVAIVLAILSR